jgi:hypothetical protein
MRIRIRDPRIFFIICFFSNLFYPGSGMDTFRIRDKHLGSATLLFWGATSHLPIAITSSVASYLCSHLLLLPSVLHIENPSPGWRWGGGGGRGKGLKSDDIKITVDFFLYIPLTTLPHSLQRTNLL